MKNMLDTARGMIDLFRLGEQVADPALWKNSQLAVTVLAGLITALVQMAGNFGVVLHLSADQTTTLANSLFYLVGAYNVVMTLVTSRHVGVLPAKAPPAAVAATVPLPVAAPAPVVQLDAIGPLPDEPNPNAS